MGFSVTGLLLAILILVPNLLILVFQNRKKPTHLSIFLIHYIKNMVVNKYEEKLFTVVRIVLCWGK